MEILILDQSGNAVPKILKPSHLKQIKSVDPHAKVTVVSQGSKESKKKLQTAEIVIGQANDVLSLTDTPKLKWLHITSAGANTLSSEIVNSDLLVTNSSGVHPIPISEHVLGLMLMLVRGLHQAVKIQHTEKKWVRDMNIYQPDELAGKKLLIVGMGRIGERVARLGQAFEMEVVGVVRNTAKHQGAYQVVSVKEMDKHIRDSDFVVNCLPLTPETKNIFDKKRLSKFKTGSFFINIGRGESVDEEALIEALNKGKIKGAGLDVFAEEPLPKESPFWEMDNVIVTPHYSGANPNYFDRVITIFCENLSAFLNKKTLPQLVDKKLGY